MSQIKEMVKPDISPSPKANICSSVTQLEGAMKSDDAPTLKSSSSEKIAPIEMSFSQTKIELLEASQKLDLKPLRDLLASRPVVRMTQRDSHVCRELVNSEKIYYHRLCILEKNFCKPICAFLTTKNTLNDPRRSKASELLKTFLGTTIVQIRDFTNELYTLMNDALMKDNPMGLVFVQKAPLLWVYYEYYEKIYNVRSSIDYLLHDPDFKDLIISLERAEETQDLGLNTFLQEPVQRVPRYKLLLERLLKETASRHVANHRALTKAVKGVTNALARLNEHLKETDMREKVKGLSADWNENFDAPDRDLMRVGELISISSNRRYFHKRKHKRFFLLFNDVIVEGKRNNLLSKKILQRWCHNLDECILFDSTSITYPHGKHFFANTDTAEYRWKLYGAKWSGIQEEKKSLNESFINYGQKYGLPSESSFVIGNPSASYLIICESSYEKMEWVRCISEQMKHANSRRKTTRFSLADIDGDGQVSITEFKRWASIEGNLSPIDAEKLFHLVDEDKNGAINMREFLNADVFASKNGAVLTHSESENAVRNKHLDDTSKHPQRRSSGLQCYVSDLSVESEIAVRNKHLDDKSEHPHRRNSGPPCYVSDFSGIE